MWGTLGLPREYLEDSGVQDATTTREDGYPDHKDKYQEKLRFADKL